MWGEFLYLDLTQVPRSRRKVNRLPSLAIPFSCQLPAGAALGSRPSNVTAPSVDSLAPPVGTADRSAPARSFVEPPADQEEQDTYAGKRARVRPRGTGSG